MKIKKFFTIFALKLPNSLESILAVFKYLRRLLTRTLWPKVLNNNPLLWLLSYNLLTPSQILVSLNLRWHNFILVWKKILLFLSYLSLSKFDAPSWKCAKEFAPISKTKSNVVENFEIQPKDLYFSKRIFSGFILCATYTQKFEFLNAKIDKKISQQVRNYYSFKLCLLQELRDQNLH